MYSVHIEGKSVVAERFIRTLKNKIFKHMTSISIHMYIDKLDDETVNKYNNAYHKTIKMKPVDAELITYFDFDKNNNKEDLKFRVFDHGRISKYKTFLQRVTLHIGVKNVL